MSTESVFADYASTTPCDPEVVEAMLPFFSEHFANPASQTHAEGRQAERAIERAREQVARFVNARPHEILFAASSTEANNIAIQGLRNVLRDNQLDLAYTHLEHKSVSRTIEATAKFAGTTAHVVDLLPNGTISLEALDNLLTEVDLGLASLQFANNEIGTIQDLEQMAQIVHERGAILHTDATQGLTTHAIDVRALNVDLLAFSAHKIYGPKGVAALYVRGGVAGSQLEPIMYGGDHEWGLRPGTVNVPAVIGMGAACDLAARRRDERRTRLERVRMVFEGSLRTLIPSALINGVTAPRVSGLSSVTFPDVEAEAIIARIKTASLAFGAACDSGALNPSPTLTAIGLNRQLAFNTIRISFGDAFTERNAMDLAIEIAKVRDEILAVS